MANLDSSRQAFFHALSKRGSKSRFLDRSDFGKNFGNYGIMFGFTASFSRFLRSLRSRLIYVLIPAERQAARLDEPAFP